MIPGSKGHTFVAIRWNHGVKILFDSNIIICDERRIRIITEKEKNESNLRAHN